jgi:RsiW-degrading membrane proteinase PrsW (M82 family)
VVFLILIIYGGILWMTAAGNEEKVKKAKELITEALIGLVIVLAAYAISYFVLNQLVNASLISNTAPQSFDPNP